MDSSQDKELKQPLPKLGDIKAKENTSGPLEHHLHSAVTRIRSCSCTQGEEGQGVGQVIPGRPVLSSPTLSCALCSPDSTPGPQSPQVPPVPTPAL